MESRHESRTPSIMTTRRRPKPSWLAEHSLSVVAVGLLLLWIVGYILLDPKSHIGAFCGNAIADWSGSVVIILGTKYFIEIGSNESKPARKRKTNPFKDFFYTHSLLIFIGVTGLGWAVLYVYMSPSSKWGQVVGNIVSEWLQMAGLVFLTKKLRESGSKE